MFDIHPSNTNLDPESAKQQQQPYQQHHHHQQHQKPFKFNATIDKSYLRPKREYYALVILLTAICLTLILMFTFIAYNLHLNSERSRDHQTNLESSSFILDDYHDNRIAPGNVEGSLQEEPEPHWRHTGQIITYSDGSTSSIGGFTSDSRIYTSSDSGRIRSF